MIITESTSCIHDYVVVGPINVVVNLLETFHNLTGLPWWITIVGSVVFYRSILLTVFVPQMRNFATLELISPTTQRIRAQITAAKKAKMKCYSTCALLCDLLLNSLIVWKSVSIKKLSNNTSKRMVSTRCAPSSRPWFTFRSTISPCKQFGGWSSCFRRTRVHILS